MNKIIIIDYGLCNLRSIDNAFNHLGIPAIITKNPESLLDADHIVLPGVGAFKDGMTGLNAAGFIAPLKETASQGKIIIGICLGMQMLLTESHEFGKHQGLGFIDGVVKPFESVKEGNNYTIKVPHVGWNNINMLNNWENTPFSSIEINDQMYFVHSFFCETDSEDNVLATTKYGPYEFQSVIKKGNIYGCQFHPERSGEKGMQILKRFTNIK